MTLFLIAAAALLAVGIAGMLRPLLSGPKAPGARQTGAVVSMFRDKLRELEGERSAGTIDEAQYQESRRDIERQLLDAVAATDAPAAGPKRARWTAALVGAFLLAVPIGLYSVLGKPDAMEPSSAPQRASAQDGGGGSSAGKQAAPAITPAQVQKMIEGLVESLKKNPGDAPAWAMLARAYAYEQQYADAVSAYTRAVALSPKDARLLADLADAMAMKNGRTLEGEPMRLIEQALKIDPKDVKALALAGTGAFDHKDYAKAVAYWERALKAAPNDPNFAQTLRGSIEEARRLAGGGPVAPPMVTSATGAPTAVPPAAANAATAPPPAAKSAGSTSGVRGKVTLSASLAAKASPEDTVFVFARAAQGPRVPLALVRRQVKDLPFEFALDDSMAMMPEYTLSKYSPVIVGARISRSGDAIAAPGDLQGFSKPITVGASAVNVTIDQVVQ